MTEILGSCANLQRQAWNRSRAAFVNKGKDRAKIDGKLIYLIAFISNHHRKPHAVQRWRSVREP
jgi:hypothetical protein